MAGFLCAATLSLSLAACGGSNTQSTAAASGSGSASSAPAALKADLTLLDSFVPGEGDDMSSVFRTVLKKFQDANPDVNIDEETVANADLTTKIQTLAAADELPDIFMLKGQMASSFVKNGKVMALDDLLNSDPKWKAGFTDGIFSNFTFDNKIYAIPYQVTNTCVFYNTTLMKAAGIEQFPTTWSGLLDAVKKVKATGVTPIVLGDKEKWNAESVIMSTLGNRFTGNAWYQSIRDKSGAKFTDPEFVASLKALSDLAKAGAFNSDVNSIDGAQQRQLYMNGKAAMTIDGSWAISEFDSTAPKEVLNATEIAAIPSVEGGKGDQNAISGGAGWGYAINSHIDPSKLPAAKEFIHSVANTDFATGLAKSGTLTAMKPGDFKLNDSQITAIKFNKFQQGRAYVPVYDHQLSAGLMEIMQTGLQGLLIGQVTPEELAKSLQDQYAKE